MSAYNQIGRETIRGQDIGCPMPEQKCPDMIYISRNARRILELMSVPAGMPAFSEIEKHEDQMARYLETRNFAASDDRLVHTLKDGKATITLRGEPKTPPKSEDAYETVQRLNREFGIPACHGVEIYDIFRGESEAVCRKLRGWGYGEQLKAHAEVLASSIHHGQFVADDPRKGAIDWTASMYKEGVESTRHSRKLMAKFGMPLEQALDVFDALKDDSYRVCGTISYEGFGQLLSEKPEVLLSSVKEAKRIMPKHDLAEATIAVALMNYEEIAAENNMPYVVPDDSKRRWEEIGLDIGIVEDLDGKTRLMMGLPRDDVESSMEMNDDGDWPKAIPIFDETDEEFWGDETLDERIGNAS